MKNIACPHKGCPQFAMDESTYYARLTDGLTFYCPAGHELHYDPGVRVKQLMDTIANKDQTIRNLRESVERISLRVTRLVRANKALRRKR